MGVIIVGFQKTGGYSAESGLRTDPYGSRKHPTASRFVETLLLSSPNLRLDDLDVRPITHGDGLP